MKFSPEDDRYIYELISKNIKYFRLHNNSKYSSYGKMTQEQLAEMVDISRQHLGAIEAPNIVRPLSLDLLFAIANALDVEPYKLFLFNR